MKGHNASIIFLYLFAILLSSCSSHLVRHNSKVEASKNMSVQTDEDQNLTKFE